MAYFRGCSCDDGGYDLDLRWLLVVQSDKYCRKKMRNWLRHFSMVGVVVDIGGSSCSSIVVLSDSDVCSGCWWLIMFMIA